MQKYIFGWGDTYCKTALDNNQPLPLLQLSLISCNCKQDISVHIFCLKNLLVFLLDMFCNIFSWNVFFFITVIALTTFSVLWNNLEKYLFYMLRNGLNQVLNMILHFGDNLHLVFLCRAPYIPFCIDSVGLFLRINAIFNSLNFPSFQIYPHISIWFPCIFFFFSKTYISWSEWIVAISRSIFKFGEQKEKLESDYYRQVEGESGDTYISLYFTLVQKEGD